MGKQSQHSLKKSVIRLAKTVLVLLPLIAVLAQPVSAQSLQNFTIEKFSAEYDLTRDSEKVAQLEVRETIVANFPSKDQNHGILRAIPEKYNKNDLNLQLGSVTNELGKPVQYQSSSKNGNRVLKIGSPDRYVHGIQTYVISYRVQNVIRTFEDHDEFYWDINGDQWQQPMANVDVTLRVGDPYVSAALSNTKYCYTGSYGGQESNCTITSEQDGGGVVVKSFTNRTLQSGQTLTVVAGFKLGTFTEKKPSQVLFFASIAAATLLPLLTAIWVYFNWRKSGKDPRGTGVIIAQYSVPKDMNPVIASLVLNEEVKPEAISATLIGLCVKRYLRIHEVERKKLLGTNTQYELEAIQPLEGLSPQELDVVEMVFQASKSNQQGEVSGVSVGSRVNISDLNSKLYKKVKSLKESSNKAVTEQGYFVKDPSISKTKRASFGAAFIFIAIALIMFVPFAAPFAIGLGISGIIVLIFQGITPKRTQKGVQMKEYLLGLREYMELAEKDRIKFLQSPDGAEKVDTNDQTQVVKLYEKLLPYAMLFGLEKDWAKQFANMYESENSSPSWYVGRSGFNAVAFASATQSFSSATANAFSAPSGSGSSGLGGGGFSGGGGGGGGGGGW